MTAGRKRVEEKGLRSKRLVWCRDHFSCFDNVLTLTSRRLLHYCIAAYAYAVHLLESRWDRRGRKSPFRRERWPDWTDFDFHLEFVAAIFSFSKFFSLACFPYSPRRLLDSAASSAVEAAAAVVEAAIFEPSEPEK